jgi:hypothetical protein
MEVPEMNRRVFTTLAALVMVFGLGGAMAHAQIISADLRFPFVAGGKEMAAGKYTIERMPAGPIMLTGPDGARVMMPIITMLGRHDQDPDAEFVFDTVDGKSVLSEIWMPKKDGMLVLATGKPHTHTVVGGSNPKQ